MSPTYAGPGRYRHYKGGEYEVIGVGLEEATRRYVVAYRPVDGWPKDVATAEFWTRPLLDFNALVEVRQTPDADTCHHVPRFQKIDA